MTRGAALVCTVLLALSLARPCAAADKPPIAISVLGCGGDEAAHELKRIAAIELHAALSEAGATTPQAAEVTVTCGDDEAAELRVVDATTSKSLTRAVSMAGTPAADRPRLLALAVAELVSASWTELVTNPEPKVAPVPSRAPAALRNRARLAITPLPVLFEAVADARVFFQSGELAVGGGARFEPWLTRAFAVRLDVLGHHAEGSRRPGEISVDTVSGAVAAGTGYAWRPLRVTGTFGVRAGFARLLGGSGGQVRSVSGGWVGPELALDLEFLPRGHVHPVIAYAVGWAVVGVEGRAAGDRSVRVQGPWGSLSIGVAVD